jgi:hypothetical protein
MLRQMVYLCLLRTDRVEMMLMYACQHVRRRNKTVKTIAVLRAGLYKYRFASSVEESGDGLLVGEVESVVDDMVDNHPWKGCWRSPRSV